MPRNIGLGEHRLSVDAARTHVVKALDALKKVDLRTIDTDTRREIRNLRATAELQIKSLDDLVKKDRQLIHR